mmetsp:Transcript_53989/g.145564  ORF Transcript_53989/g.145564 Transcript_53989/m.145564 type:complete len:324 (+) Transcript_53989:124-1095(+)
MRELLLVQEALARGMEPVQLGPQLVPGVVERVVEGGVVGLVTLGGVEAPPVLLLALVRVHGHEPLVAAHVPPRVLVVLQQLLVLLHPRAQHSHALHEPIVLGAVGDPLTFVDPLPECQDGGVRGHFDRPDHGVPVEVVLQEQQVRRLHALDVLLQPVWVEDRVGVQLDDPVVLTEAAVVHDGLPGLEEDLGVGPRAPLALVALEGAYGDGRLWILVSANINTVVRERHVLLAAVGAGIPRPGEAEQVGLVPVGLGEHEAEEGHPVEPLRVGERRRYRVAGGGACHRRSGRYERDAFLQCRAHDPRDLGGAVALAAPVDVQERR